MIQFLRNRLEELLICVMALIFIILNLFVLPAWAQEALPPATPMALPADIPVPWWGQLLLGILSLALPYLISLLRTYTKAKADELAARTKVAMLSQLHDSAFNIAHDILVSQIEHWKAAASNGKLSQAEMTQAKTLAGERLKATASLEIGKLFGHLPAPHIEREVGAIVEAAVTRAKAVRTPANPT